MNKDIKFGKVFELKSLVKYQEGKVTSAVAESTPNYKLTVIAFDKGAKLAEHTAPSDALVFALKGKAVFNYEGKNIKISEGENLALAKGAKHSVTATTKFKMALLISVDENTPKCPAKQNQDDTKQPEAAAPAESK